MSGETRFDIAALRDRLSGLRGRHYWRSLEELAGTEEVARLLKQEFPSRASELDDELGRRRFLTLMGASIALAGLTGCTRQPKETISPYTQAPEEIVPGRPLYYATALTLSGIATGALVETHEGRPTKVEGNPDHPASLGASDPFMQAAVLGLYDPDRSRTVTFLGDIRPWGDLLGVLRGAVEAQLPRKGSGLRILTGSVTSPALAGQIRRILQRFPDARWHQYEPAARDNARAGSILAFGEPVMARYSLDAADVVLSLESDFMAPGPGSLRYIRDFAARRRMEGEGERRMNRLYVVESTPTITGASADHRLPLGSGAVEAFARGVAASLGLSIDGPSGARASELAPHAAFMSALARDLRDAGRRGLVIAGDQQPPAVHLLAHAMNDLLGSAGRAVVYTAPLESSPVSHLDSMRELAEAMDAGAVSLLIILGGNPVFDAPSDLRFDARLQKVPLSIHLGQYEDETSALCQWHVPQAHELESWGDARAFDGTVSIQQPLIEPLYGGKSAHEILGPLLDEAALTSHEVVRRHWRATLSAGTDFEPWWRRALHDGLIAGTELPPKMVSLRAESLARIPSAAPLGPESAAGFEIALRTDASVFDGRFANIGWLQELPRPTTRLTWDNAALISPAAAQRLGLADGDLVELETAGGEGSPLRAPILIVPGQAERTVTIHLGYGRRRAGRVGTGAGFDAYPIRTTRAPWLIGQAGIRKTGEAYPLAQTQMHHGMEGRDHVRRATLQQYRDEPGFARHGAHEPAADETLYPPHKYEGHAWGMVIDLNTCVGCNACVIGCQAENNIPVVGKEQVAIGREMHWIRVDRYFEGSLNAPSIWHQPVPCMHCENAPCEPVCPVGATVHSSEGLNDMVYNRCVGTRYCANNCPYKVRRFNFLLYSDFETPSLKLLRNPEVTVRSRGVMEKCTYCVQRINRARIESGKEGRPIQDGEIRTACQQACPAQAITFGDINDPASRVAKLRGDARNYSLLGELNTRPRTTYLAALKNPNPEIEES